MECLWQQWLCPPSLPDWTFIEWEPVRHVPPPPCVVTVVVLSWWVVVRRRQLISRKDPKMGGNRDPNSIEMQEKETRSDTHYKDTHIYENVVVQKSSGESEDRINDSYYSYVLADMYVTIQNMSTSTVEESSDSVTDGVHVYANLVTDTSHYDVPSRMGNMTETETGGNRSG